MESGWNRRLLWTKCRWKIVHRVRSTNVNRTEESAGEKQPPGAVPAEVAETVEAAVGVSIHRWLTNSIWVNHFYHKQFWFFYLEKKSYSLGDAAAALPQWPDLEADSSQLPPGIDIDDLQAFVTLYRDHCEVSYREEFPFWNNKSWIKCFVYLNLLTGDTRCGYWSPVQHSWNDLASFLAQRQQQRSRWCRDGRRSWKDPAKVSFSLYFLSIAAAYSFSYFQGQTLRFITLRARPDLC